VTGPSHWACDPAEMHTRDPRQTGRDDGMPTDPFGRLICDECGRDLFWCRMIGDYCHADAGVLCGPTVVEVSIVPLCSAYCPGDYIEETGNHFPECDQFEDHSCPSCSEPIGAHHLAWCDVARCLATGLQRGSCESAHAHGRDIWAGRWPGEAECVEYGLLTPDGPDLNRLYVECTWDAERRRWVR
jgi:hypothetical protein